MSKPIEQYTEEFGALYRQGERWQTVVVPHMLSVLPDATTHPVVADFGCGTGDFLPYLLERGHVRIIGIDQSESMLGEAVKRYASMSTVEFVHHPVQGIVDTRVDLRESVDLVVSIMVVPVINSREGVGGFFDSARTVLRQGGKFIMCVPHPQFDGYMQTSGAEYDRSGSPYNTTQVFDDFALTYTDHHWTIEDYVGFYTRAGFSIDSLVACGSVDAIPGSYSHLIMVGTKM